MNDNSIFKSSKAKEAIILVCLFFLFLKVCINQNDRALQGVIWSDVEGYYMYLPAIFIYKDFHKVPQRSMDFRRNDKGEVVMKYTCGVAPFFLPFFIGAHLYTLGYHLDASGFSDPYYYAMILCGVFWGIIGWYLLKRLISRYYGDSVAWITVIAILMGTNFFHYSTKEVGMSHIYSFALAALLLLLADAYYKSPDRKKAISISFTLGWLILIRPTNCLMSIFVLFLNITSRKEFIQRLIFLRSRINDIWIALPFTFLAMIPQLLYWKEMTGKLVTYSYKGEGFIYWRHPKILDVLFDTQDGLFLFSPVLLFTFIGILWRKDRRANTYGTIIMFALSTYVFASWWQWCFGAAYGHRCYIEYLPMYAMPMGLFIEKVSRSGSIIVKTSTALVIGLFVYYSINMSLLYDDTQFWGGPEWIWNYPKWFSMVKQIF